MRRLRRFLRLPAQQRLLLLESAVVVGSLRAGLLLASFEALERFVKRAASVSPGRREVSLAQRQAILWAVGVAAHYVPGASCLTRTLAAQFLLGRRGCVSRVRIGVARRGEDRLAAHAWLERLDGSLIYDPEDRSRYTALPPLEAAGGLGSR